jgi:hypothetical protein
VWSVAAGVAFTVVLAVDVATDQLMRCPPDVARCRKLDVSPCLQRRRFPGPG